LKQAIRRFIIRSFWQCDCGQSALETVMEFFAPRDHFCHMIVRLVLQRVKARGAPDAHRHATFAQTAPGELRSDVGHGRFPGRGSDLSSHSELSASTPVRRMSFVIGYGIISMTGRPIPVDTKITMPWRARVKQNQISIAGVLAAVGFVNRFPLAAF
jgi:hypothetical protein